MGWAKSGPEFHVNSGSCRVGSLHLWVGLGRVKKIGPTSNSGLSTFGCRSFCCWTDGQEYARSSLPHPRSVSTTSIPQETKAGEKQVLGTIVLPGELSRCVRSVSAAELDAGPIFLTRPNPTHK